MKTEYNNLPEQIDYLISEIAQIKQLLRQEVEKPEEIPKFLGINQALAYMAKLGFLLSKSKLYKLTSENRIPCHKSNARVYFLQQELENWVSAQIEVKSETGRGFSDQSKQYIINSTQTKKKYNEKK